MLVMLGGESARGEAREDACSLEDGVEGGGEHDAGHEEGDLLGPGCAVEVGVVVGCQ